MLLTHPVFIASDCTFTWSDLVDAAKIWGDWEQCKLRAAASRAANAAAAVAAAGREFEAAEEHWRRERRLLAAEELEQWLANGEIELDEWRDYIAGTVLADVPIDGEPVDEHRVWVQALCSGALDDVARRLAARVAVAGAPTPEPLTRAALDRLDRGYERFCDAAATPAAIERELERRRLDWLAVDWRLLASEDEAVIREAALCIRDDGTGFEAVAQAAGLPVKRRLDTLEELGDELRAQLLGAPAGTLLGPFRASGRFVVAEVLARRAPDAGDASAAARARDAVIERATARAVNERIRWCAQ